MRTRRTLPAALALLSTLALAGCSVELPIRIWKLLRPTGTAGTDRPAAPTVEMLVGPLLSDAAGNVAVILHNAERTRALRVFVGAFEGQAILLAKRREITPRPMTHDLCSAIIRQMNARVEKVTITRIENDTFFAALDLRQGEQRIRIDARPSDSIVLAQRAQRPIYVAKEVLQKAGIDLKDLAPDATPGRVGT